MRQRVLARNGGMSQRTLVMLVVGTLGLLHFAWQYANRVTYDPAVCGELWMADVDRRAFMGALTDRAVQQYLEWGGGGSTLCAAALVANVTTIEHNIEWCERLRQRIDEDEITNVNLICSPVAWDSWGDTPEGDGTYEDFDEYVDAVDYVDIAHYDVVFIDGRARSSCARKALNYISNETTVMVHDWGRQHYHESMLAFYDELEPIRPLEALALLRKINSGP